MSHWQDKRTCGRGEAVEEKEEIRMSETRLTVARIGNVPMGKEGEGKQGETAGEDTGIKSSIQATSHIQERKKQEETSRSKTPERRRGEDATDTENK